MIYLLLEADYSLARRLIREIMQLGVEAVWTQHAEDAQLLLKQQHFDLVILSLHSIDDLARQILSELGHRDRKIPFVVLLEQMGSEDRRLVLGLGAAACLSKPLAPWALSRHLRVAMQSPPKRVAPKNHARLGAFGRLRAPLPENPSNRGDAPIAVDQTE